MKKVSEFFKNLGFTFSIRRLRKAILLILLFSFIGLGVYLFYEYESSESGLKRIYTKEVSRKYDLQENKVIDIEKLDVNDDRTQDYVFIIGQEIRSDENSLNSIVELYKNVSLVILDGETNEVKQFDTKKDFKSDIDLNIYEDEKERYFLVSDLSGNISLNILDDSNNLIDIIKNTTDKEFLGYTIYTSQNDENKDILSVNIDNFSKDYLGEYSDSTDLNLAENGIDISNYRETYLRDKFSNFNLIDTNNDGILEFVGYQYVLYSLDDNTTLNKTVGVIETIFNIEDNKLKFNSVNIHI